MHNRNKWLSYDYIIGYVTPWELFKIEALGISYIVEIDDLNKHNENVWDNLGYVDGNATTTEIT